MLKRNLVRHNRTKARGRTSVPLQPGTIIGGHRILRTLGAGGSGTVYLARHPRLHRDVALKVINDSHTESREIRAAFDRETQLVAGLNHANIIDVYDRNALDDPTDTHLWLSMRYIAGGDLTTLITTTPNGLTPERAVELITDIARGLDHAHTHGTMHRDVKPGNVLLDEDRAVLTDFGIARALGSTVTDTHVAASLNYAAPERFRRQPITNRSDIYSLGATLYQLLTGRVPFPTRDPAALINAHLHAAPPAPTAARPDLPDYLDHVITTAMAKDPDDRYTTCLELATNALRAITTTTYAPPISTPNHQLDPQSPVIRQENAQTKRPFLAHSDPMFKRDIGREAALRRAAERGDKNATFTLGYLLESRGDLTEAETWYRRAAYYGHKTSMRSLARLLEYRVDLAEAETWYRRAADSGDKTSLGSLARLVEKRGDLTEAETWHRRAADSGDKTSMGSLARLLEKRGNLTEAETWYRRRADDGDDVNAISLANLLEKRGNLDEAETWYRHVAERGFPPAMQHLADLLEKRGKHAEAETWRRKHRSEAKSLRDGIAALANRMRRHGVFDPERNPETP
ncbi:protein kinase [Nocardia sp. NPDC058518]|uniref:protein kinase domain-containing protein n=1 Tax=Nocardia sp. NPDC058518 TaxID=3346534 RepID=UPI003661F9EF